MKRKIAAAVLFYLIVGVLFSGWYCARYETMFGTERWRMSPPFVAAAVYWPGFALESACFESWLWFRGDKPFLLGEAKR